MFFKLIGWWWYDTIEEDEAEYSSVAVYIEERMSIVLFSGKFSAKIGVWLWEFVVVHMEESCGEY